MTGKTGNSRFDGLAWVVPLFALTACATPPSGTNETSSLVSLTQRDEFIAFQDVLRENIDTQNECNDFDPVSRTCTTITIYLLAGATGSSIAEFQLEEDPFVSGIGTAPIVVRDGVPCMSFGDAELEIISDDLLEAEPVGAITEKVLTAYTALGELCVAYFSTDVEW